MHYGKQQVFGSGRFSCTPRTGMSSFVAVHSRSPCRCSIVYSGVSGANHGGQTCVAAPLLVIMSTLLFSCVPARAVWKLLRS